MTIQLIALGVVILLFVLREAREIWIALDDSRIRANLIYPDQSIKRHVVKVTSRAGRASSVTIKGKTYRVVPERIYRTGLWRVPTSYYVTGKTTPLELTENPGDISATDYYQAVENNITEGLLRFFQKPLLTPEVSLLILGILIAGGIGYLWWDGQQQFTQVMQILDPTGTGVGAGFGGGGQTPTLPNDF